MSAVSEVEMSAMERLSWMARTKNLNHNRELSVGMRVKDAFGNLGIVVKLDIPKNPSMTDRGVVYVWQSERVNHGADNCEHYSYLNWKDFLRIEE